MLAARTFLNQQAHLKHSGPPIVRQSLWTLAPWHPGMFVERSAQCSQLSLDDTYFYEHLRQDFRNYCPDVTFASSLLDGYATNRQEDKLLSSPLKLKAQRGAARVECKTRHVNVGIFEHMVHTVRQFRDEL